MTNLLIKANKGNNTKNKFFPLSLNWLMFGIPLVLYLLLWLVVKRQIYPQPLREGQIFERMIAGILGRNFHLSELGYLLQEWGLRSLNPEVWGAGGFAIIVCLVIWLWQAKRGARILSPMFVSGIIITGGVLFLYYLLIFDTNHDISWWVSTSFDRLWMPAFIFLWIGGWQQCCSNCVVD